MQWQEFRSHIRHLPARDITKIGEAFELGKKMHGDQKRRSGEPYFNHPIAVAHMLLALEADTDTIIAALLHDTVEDTSLSLAEIERAFDSGVAPLIDGVTKLSSKDVAMSPKLDEQIETLRKIFTLMQQDVRIMIIKLVDRLHNMQTVEFLPPERQRLLAKETLEVFVKIADKLCMQDMRDELESLCLAVLEPEIYSTLLELRNQNEQRGADLIEHIRTNVRAHDRILASKVDLSFEAKTWDQVKAQLNVGGSVATGVSFLTVAFVCDDIDTCYRVLGTLHQLWKREVLSFQDFINEPQLNGYRGLHTTIIAPGGTRVRCKIRTKEMHVYARSGITTKCFDAKALGLADYLPWTERLSSLAADTEGNSDDFWENLKSDILGESIIIHGPGDSTVRLPRNATALDGAFFLFQDQALKTKALKLNGVDVPFSSPLSNAASLDVRFDDTVTCNRDWLRQVQTGFAAAQIHAALGSLPPEQKIAIGQLALQEVMTDRGKGLLEEFDTEKLAKVLQRVGMPSMKNVLIEIAEGKQSATDVFAKLFSRTKHGPATNERIVSFRITFSMDQSDASVLQKLSSLSDDISIQWGSVRIHQVAHTMQYSFTVRTTDTGVEMTQRLLESAGATDFKKFPIARHSGLLMFLIILLWGLNPVAAKWFFIQGISPLTLVSVRMMTFGACTTLFYIFWRSYSGRRFKPVPHLTRLTLLPSVTTAGLAIFTYEALAVLPPSLHITIIRCNALLLPFLFAFRRKASWLMTVVILFLFGIGAWLLTVPTSASIALGITSSVMALVLYGKYSVIMEETLDKNTIGLRYPALLFRSGLLLAIFGILLIPITPWHVLTETSVFLMTVYTIGCVFIPHALYALLLNSRQVKRLSDLFFAEPPIAMLAEALLLGIFLPLWLYGIMVFMLCTVYIVRHWKDLRTKSLLHH